MGPVSYNRSSILDTNLFLTGKNLDEIKIQFNEKLKTISLWFQTNLLSLNVSKTSYIVFTNRVVSSNIDLFIDDVKIDRVFETKFLGVVITHRLSWKPHIAIVCSKMSKNIGIIAKVRHLFSFQMKMDVHSHFTRQHCRLHTAFCRTRTRQRTLHYQGPKIWNDLPHDMKTLRFSLFKRRIKNYILNQ